MARLYPQKQVADALTYLRSRGYSLEAIHRAVLAQGTTVVELKQKVDVCPECQDRR